MEEISPGIHRGIDLNIYKNGLKFGRSEKHLIWQLKQIWYVTFIDIAKFKGSVYYYAMLKPTSKIRESFRLDREVLVVMQQYDNFEARTLDFVDKLMFEFQNRLDKLVFILVTQDAELKGKIKQLTLQEQKTK